MDIDYSKAAVLRVTDTFLVNFLSQFTEGASSLRQREWKLIKNGLPLDTVFLRAFYDGAGCMCFLLYHPSFPSHKEGMPYAELPTPEFEIVTRPQRTDL